MRAARTSAGSGSPAAPGIAGLLGFAAMPVFALMAVWTGLSGGAGDMMCLSMADASPLGGMTMMYGLMALFHAAPWLRLIQRR